jgi:hypothetical protein
VSAARARCGRCTPFIWRFCPRISACNAHPAVLPAWRARFQRPWLPWAFLGASSAGGPNRHSVARSAAAHAAPRSRAPQLSPRRTRQRDHGAPSQRRSDPSLCASGRALADHYHGS